jgi:hypothetical protein
MLCDASALAPHCACGSASWRSTHVTQTQSVSGISCHHFARSNPSASARCYPPRPYWRERATQGWLRRLCIRACPGYSWMAGAALQPQRLASQLHLIKCRLLLAPPHRHAGKPCVAFCWRSGSCCGCSCRSQICTVMSGRQNLHRLLPITTPKVLALPAGLPADASCITQLLWQRSPFSDVLYGS